MKCTLILVIELFSYMAKMPRSWAYVASPSGYVTNGIFLDWLHNYIKQTGNGVHHTLLIMDNHESHTTLDVARLAVASNVHIILQPPHSSHFLQPLDCIFRLLKDAFARKCQELGMLGSNVQVILCTGTDDVTWIFKSVGIKWI